MTDKKTWTNVDAGPRMIKPLKDALSALRREGQTHDELTGVVGGDEHRTAYWVPMGVPVRPEVAALEEAIGEKYSYQITKKTLKAIITDLEAALPEAVKSRPVDDKRRSADEDAEIKAKIAARQAEDQAQRDAADALLAQVLAKAPAGAKALIIAELKEDRSDTQTDYWNNVAVRTVAIGFRSGSREDFRQLRAAAAAFPDTADVEFTEQRNPGNNYLSDHGWDGAGSGWIIASRQIDAPYLNLTGDAIPASAPAEATAAPAATSNGDGITISPDSAGRPGIIEIRFPGKPSAEVRKGLKDHKFGFSGRDGVWRGRDVAFADQAFPGARREG